VPLIMWQDDGHAAQFCEECQRQWWGIESYSGDEDGSEIG
jgi:hypothetical protein